MARLISRIPLAISVILLAALASSQLMAAYKPGEVLVRYKAGKRPTEAAAAVGGTAIAQIDQIRTQLVKLPGGLSVEDAVKRLRADPNVEYAGPNHIVYICLEPNDEWFLFFDILYMQWGLYSDSYPDAGIDAPDAWDITTGGSDVTIAIVDTGVYRNHEDLWSKIVPGRNVISGANPDSVDDDHGHGTFIAGIAAAQTNNTIGVAGVSWGAMIMPIKALDYNGYGTEADAAAGIIWAADHGAKIINMSFGGYDDMPVEEDAVAYAWNAGCVLVGASGNDGASQDFFPAAYDQVIATGASNEYGERCTDADWGEGGSNYGSYLDVMAPGNEIMSTYWDTSGGSYNFASGTSAAAPFVSGTAALLMSHQPTWTNLEIVNQIKLTCKDMETTGWDEFTGWGLISAYRALALPQVQAVALTALNGKEDGALIKTEPVVLTAASGEFADRFYVEQENRAAAAMLAFTHAPSGYVEGDIIEAIGALATLNGERCLDGVSLSKLSHRDPLRPLGMPSRDVGGIQLGNKPGTDGGRGLNNLSLLVTVYGRVTAVGWTYFYIDDGSTLYDGSGLKVICDGLSKPSRGSFVRVTGISSCEQPPESGATIPVVRVRKQADILALF